MTDMLSMEKKKFIELMEAVENFDKTDNDEMIQKLIEKFTANEDLYETELALVLWKFEDMFTVPFKKVYDIKETDSMKLSILTYLYNGLLEHFLFRNIAKYEGNEYLEYKVDFAIKMVKKSLIEGHSIPLSVNYEDLGEKFEGKRGRTSWSLIIYEDTDQLIRCFFKWYNLEK